MNIFVFLSMAYVLVTWFPQVPYVDHTIVALILGAYLICKDG